MSCRAGWGPLLLLGQGEQEDEELKNPVVGLEVTAKAERSHSRTRPRSWKGWGGEHTAGRSPGDGLWPFIFHGLMGLPGFGKMAVEGHRKGTRTL